MKWDNFKRWFNHDFWRAFTKKSLPIKLPPSYKREEFLKRVFSAVSRREYYPSTPQSEIMLNKGHGVTRMVPVFKLEDYCVYFYCIKELEDVLCVNRTENTFGGWSLGGKLRRSEAEEMEAEVTDYGRYAFNPSAWTQAFGEFSALLFAQMDAGTHPHVLQFDLANFYDSVRLDALERRIREAASSGLSEVISLLFHLLNHWNRRNTRLHPQIVGLPHDALADCSRILANFYLQEFDAFAAKVIAKVNGVYFRYADDQMIFLKRPEDAERVMLLLTRKLDQFGLRVNQKKVILWEADELERHRCRSIQGIFAKKGDNKNPDKVRLFVDALLAMNEIDIAMTWNGGMPLLNRLLYANLESLPKSILGKVMKRLLSESFIRQATSEKLTRLQELNNKLSQRTQRIDLLAELRDLSGRMVHNSFHYEALAYACSIKDTKLTGLLRRRITSLHRQIDSVTIQ